MVVVVVVMLGPEEGVGESEAADAGEVGGLGEREHGAQLRLGGHVAVARAKVQHVAGRVEQDAARAARHAEHGLVARLGLDPASRTRAGGPGSGPSTCSRGTRRRRRRRARTASARCARLGRLSRQILSRSSAGSLGKRFW